MSTKIYCAFRFPLTRAENGIRAFHELLLEGALEHFSDALDRLDMELYNRNIEGVECLKPKTEEFKTAEGKYIALQDMISFGDNFTKRVWDNMSCGFHSWIYDGYMYVIPWASYNAGNYFPKVEDQLPDFVEEFGYWNNTDPPEEFRDDEGYARWEARGKLWEKVGPGGHKPGPEPGCLSHDAVDFSNYMGSNELMKLYRKRNNLKNPWV